MFSGKTKTSKSAERQSSSLTENDAFVFFKLIEPFVNWEKIK